MSHINYCYREHPDAIIPKKQKPNDAGFDVYSIENILIPAKTRILVPTGLRIVCANGFYYTFSPRSGLAFKNNIIPSHYNVMDSNWTGNCDVLMWNRSEYDYLIKKGDRFCQILFHRVEDFIFEEVDVNIFERITIDKEYERGQLGFGSSGK